MSYFYLGLEFVIEFENVCFFFLHTLILDEKVTIHVLNLLIQIYSYQMRISCLALFSMLFHLAFSSKSDNGFPQSVLEATLSKQECIHNFFHGGAWLNPMCIQHVAINLMGYCVMAIAAIVKLPQILKIINNKSTEGVSFGDVILDVATQFSAVAYNMSRQNPLSVYGERFMVGLQGTIVAILFLIYHKKSGIPLKEISGLAVILIIIWAAINPAYFPKYILDNVLIVQIVLFTAARLCQIKEIHRLGSTGNLSGITYVLNCTVNLARLVTSIVELPSDMHFRWSVYNAFSLNAYIVGCFVFLKKEKINKPNQNHKD